MPLSVRCDEDQTIIQLSDLHFSVGCQQLPDVLKHIEMKFIGDKKIILSGDLVANATSTQYRQLEIILQKTNYEIYAIPGNHDNLQLMKQHLLKDRIQFTKDLVCKNWVLLFLDTSNPGINLGSGRLIKSDLIGLDCALKKHIGKNVIIIMHHPPITFGADWFKKICLENLDDFKAVVKSHTNIRAVLFGHAHTSYQTTVDGVKYICSPSSWVQFDHSINDKLAYKNIGPGYNWYKLKQNGSFKFGTVFLCSGEN